MRPLVALIILILVTGSAYAGSYTVTTTPEQDEALKVLVSKRHPLGAPAGTALLTPQQLIQQVVDSYVRNTVSGIQRDAACAKVTDVQAKQALGCAPTK